MSQNTEQVEQVEQVEKSEPENAVFVALHTMIADHRARANAISDEIKASRVDAKVFIHEMRNDPDTTDPDVQKYQADKAKADAAVEAWTVAIDAKLAAKVPAQKMSDEVLAAKSAEQKELAKKAKSFLATAALVDGFDESYFEDIEPLSGGGSSTPGDTKRPQLASATVNGEKVFVTETRTYKDGSEVTVDNVTFTILAAHISKLAKSTVKSKDLQAAAFEAAGTDELSTVSSVEYSHSVNGQNFDITVIPASPSK